MDLKFLVLGLLVLEMGFAFDDLGKTINNVCFGIKSLLPPIAVLMFIGAGVVYAGGQFVGAETRARANVWATNMMIGAIIGLIIAAVLPTALVALNPGGAPSATWKCEGIIA